MTVDIYLNEKLEKFSGRIEKKNNRFYAYIDVPNEVNLYNIINYIRGYIPNYGDVTLVNNVIYTRTISVSGSRNTLYIYEASYCISGIIDTSKLLISTLILHYKESDYFFIKYKPTRNRINEHNKFKIIQKTHEEVLLENNEYIISYKKYGAIQKDEYGNKIFRTPSDIIVKFKNFILMNKLDEEIRKIERVFGFVFCKKMNLIDMQVVDIASVTHDVFPQYLKNYNDVILEPFNIVDLTTKRILKSVLKSYFDDSHISSSINMYYEYIYNDLDKIFEFTSLVNTIELLLSSNVYYDLVLRYNETKNIKFKTNKLIMKGVLGRLTKEEFSVINDIYNPNHIDLRYRLYYIFYKYFKLDQSEASDKYISLIVNTRNYYVHGGKKKLLNVVQLTMTVELLKQMLYLLILKASTTSSNILTDTYIECVPNIYNSIINDLTE